MKRRCLNPRDRQYPEWGGRGITICNRWLDFNNFYADMGERPEGMTLERKDNNGNYEPGNVKWATATEQQQNTRKNVIVEIEGETHTMNEWCRRLGIRSSTVSTRVKRGMTHLEALTKEVRR